MARLSFILGITTSFLVFLFSVSAVEIDDIFVLPPGLDADDGDCGGRLTVLDQWLSEGIESLDVTLNAIDDYRNNPAVRRSMSTFFGIPNNGRPSAADNTLIQGVRTRIEQAQNFYNQQKNAAGTPYYDSAGFWLVCGSNWLTLKQPADTAQDYTGKDIVDQQNNAVPIQSIGIYATQLAADRTNRPWWGGDLTELKGYYFSQSGGNYCQGTTNLAVTARIQPLVPDTNGQARREDEIATIILCPFSFPGGQASPQPDSYLAANNLLAARTDLARAVPKSATLLHELFHAIYGTALLSGAEEEYDLGECINLANTNPGQARRNIENYIFFVAHMYHLLGDQDGTEPWSIPRKWDFAVQTVGGTRVFGARNP